MKEKIIYFSFVCVRAMYAWIALITLGLVCVAVTLLFVNKAQIIAYRVAQLRDYYVTEHHAYILDDLRTRHFICYRDEKAERLRRLWTELNCEVYEPPCDVFRLAAHRIVFDTETVSRLTAEFIAVRLHLLKELLPENLRAYRLIRAHLYRLASPRTIHL